MDLLTRIADLPGGDVVIAGAQSTAAPVYVVGGAIRDLLLGRTPEEIDVAIEGPIGPFVAALGGDVLEHPRFETATVTGEGWKVDVARCRAESYAAPGTLPLVTPTDLPTDLARRDVTVNAVAVSLDNGTMTAFPGAEADLAAGRLRVLSDHSLTDDPTRLWRLVRYAARLGFTVERETEGWAVTAVGNGALTTVSNARVGNELRLLLREGAAVVAVAAAHRFGLLDELAPDVAEIDRALALSPEDARRDLVVLAGSLRLFPRDAIAQRLTAWEFTANERDVVLKALDVRRGGHRVDGTQPSDIARTYRALPAEAVVWAPAPDRPAARRWLSELRTVGLVITGDDLLAAGGAPGQSMGRALAMTLDAVLDGKVGGAAHDQLAFALAQLAP